MAGEAGGARARGRELGAESTPGIRVAVECRPLESGKMARE